MIKSEILNIPYSKKLTKTTVENFFKEKNIYTHKKTYIWTCLEGQWKNPLANAGDTGSIPGPERLHMALSN